jgi:hypothetical protein
MRMTRRCAVALVVGGVVFVLAGLVSALLNAVVLSLAVILVGWYAAMWRLEIRRLRGATDLPRLGPLTAFTARLGGAAKGGARPELPD